MDNNEPKLEQVLNFILQHEPIDQVPAPNKELLAGILRMSRALEDGSFTPAERETFISSKRYQRRLAAALSGREAVPLWMLLDILSGDKTFRPAVQIYLEKNDDRVAKACLDLAGKVDRAAGIARAFKESHSRLLDQLRGKVVRAGTVLLAEQAAGEATASTAAKKPLEFEVTAEPSVRGTEGPKVVIKFREDEISPEDMRVSATVSGKEHQGRMLLLELVPSPGSPAPTEPAEGSAEKEMLDIVDDVGTEPSQRIAAAVVLLQARGALPVHAHLALRELYESNQPPWVRADLGRVITAAEAERPLIIFQKKLRYDQERDECYADEIITGGSVLHKGNYFDSLRIYWSIKEEEDPQE